LFLALGLWYVLSSARHQFTDALCIEALHERKSGRLNPIFLPAIPVVDAVSVFGWKKAQTVLLVFLRMHVFVPNVFAAESVKQPLNTFKEACVSCHLCPTFPANHLPSPTFDTPNSKLQQGSQNEYRKPELQRPIVSPSCHPGTQY
jgi:hypothetical protein